MKAPDIAASDGALKVKQFLNATKSKNKIPRKKEGNIWTISPLLGKTSVQ